MQWQNNQQQTFNRVNPDEFVDMALKNAASYKFQIAQTVVGNQSVNMTKFKEYYVMLVNDAESACIGCRFITKAKRKFIQEELTLEEIELMDALRKYFRAIAKDSKSLMLAAQVENKARSFLREAIEGFYDAKVNKRREEIVTDSSIPIEDREFCLANYRYQLLLESTAVRKLSRVDAEM